MTREELHMLAKLVIAAVLGAAAFVTFYQPMYHVRAPSQFEAIGKQPVSIPFVCTYAFSDGQITAFRLYFDQMDLVTQLGLG